MPEVLVSVVTPSLNSEPYIEQCIRSVIEQPVPDIEHIVIDGDSTDGTIDVLRRYPHLRWCSEPDDGQASALNKGFGLAEGEIVGWLNSDDTYAPGAIQVAVEYLLRNPNCDLVYGDCNILREDGTLLTVFRSKHVEGWERLLGGYIHTPAVFFRRRIFDRVGYLDESLHFVMDNEFWLRLAPFVRLAHVPTVLANFHHRPGSKSVVNSLNFGLEMCRIYEETLPREPYASQIPSEIGRQKLARCYWRAGVKHIRAGISDKADILLTKALEDFEVLRFRKIVTEVLISRYSRRDLLSWQEVEETVSLLPLGAIDRDRVLAWCRSDYRLARFYASHNRRDWPEVRLSGLAVAIRNPRLLRSRGFLSVWVESIVGSRFFRAVKQFV